MSYRRTLVFLAIFLVLVAVYYFYEYKGAEARKEAEEKEKLILSFEPDEVTALTLTKPDERIVIRREDDAWMIVEPVSGPADANVVGQVLDTVSTLKYERDLGSQSELEPFGLSEPVAAVEVSSEGGAIGAVLAGDSTPDGSNFYVKRAGDNTVFTAAQSAKSRLDRTLFDLRDKTVVDFSIADVDELAIQRGARRFTFERTEEGEWSMTSPEEHAADAGAITSVLDAVRYGRVKSFVEEEAEDLTQYGLEEPQARIELVLDGETRSLSFGDTDKEAKLVYARRDAQRQVVALEAGILDKLSGELSDWRDKRLVRLERGKVEKLMLDSDSGRVTLARLEDKPGEWKMTEPAEAAADEDRVEGLLSELWRARIIGFLASEEQKEAAAAFEGPVIRVSIWGEDGEAPEVVELANPGDDSGAYAKIAKSGEIVQVNPALLTALRVAPEELKDRSVLGFRAADVERIELVKGEEEPVEIVRKDIEWKVPRELEAESYEIDQLLWELADLKYQTVETKEKGKDYGLDSPVLTIRLWLKEAEAPVLLVAGKKTEKGTYYVRSNDEAAVMEADGSLIDEWIGKMERAD
ncbi:MAG: hypothetical protein Kow0099_27190 [Candidatus Abyssubacteria bacterium]